MSYYDRSNNWTHSSGTIPINEWVHVAMSFQTGSNNLKFYKNKGFKSIMVNKIPNIGIGMAINDRLKRASNR